MFFYYRKFAIYDVIVCMIMSYGLSCWRNHIGYILAVRYVYFLLNVIILYLYLYYLKHTVTILKWNTINMFVLIMHWKWNLNRGLCITNWENFNDGFVITFSHVNNFTSKIDTWDDFVSILLIQKRASQSN